MVRFFFESVDTDRDLNEPEGWRSSSLRKILLQLSSTLVLLLSGLDMMILLPSCLPGEGGRFNERRLNPGLFDLVGLRVHIPMSRV